MADFIDRTVKMNEEFNENQKHFLHKVDKSQAITYGTVIERDGKFYSTLDGKEVIFV